MKQKLLLAGILLCQFSLLVAQKHKPDEVIKSLDKQTEHYGEMAQQIWTYAELGYQEEWASNL